MVNDIITVFKEVLMQLTESQEYLKNTNLPTPITPVPLDTEMFPNLPCLIKENTSSLPSRLSQLSHYFLTTSWDAYHRKFCTTAPNIAIDDHLCIEMFQGFGLEFDPWQESLAVSSGIMKPIYYEGTELGISFIITQFQTAIFKNKAKFYTEENEMYHYLGFFDWRAVLIEYYKQSIAFLREIKQTHPPFLAVELLRYAQLRRLSERYRRYDPLNQKKRELEEERIKVHQTRWLQSLGFDFKGDKGYRNTDLMFLDSRDIELNPYFASNMELKT